MLCGPALNDFAGEPAILPVEHRQHDDAYTDAQNQDEKQISRYFACEHVEGLRAFLILIWTDMGSKKCPRQCITRAAVQLVNLRLGQKKA